ncbi:beta-lactamase/transpeptidase-like protein [Aspergillus caelatus]|uniref:Beta-lactamase/transpeptidase-like protein n=1 Tax=Aspergillus caelatus TaxID=61420 RepID=A0A5N6ZZE4_9EURO|nr:beta-lactamase/transpeptidase-like protein [Aspergillus caelatus]KAE8362643.1 beta-lactamase/transpeptidase-like protein [Aspergillus caelatus]
MCSIDNAIESFLGQEGPPLPRVTLGAVNRDGTLHYVKCFDGNSAESSKPDDIHWIASATKFITSIAVMQCVERGLLELDADISRILPEWKDPKILIGFDEKNEPQFRRAKRPLTLRHLITHSAGLAYTFMHPLCIRYQELQGERPLVLQTIRESFPTFLVFEPGEQWLYGPGLEWAGLMVEHVTGLKLGEYMRQNMFVPVGASDITFHLHERPDLQARKVKLWERNNDGLKEVTDFWWPEPVSDDIGGGGIYTNVPELLKIYAGVMQGKLLRPETVEQMFKPHLEKRNHLDNREEYDLATRNAIYNAVPNTIPVDYGLGGLINTVEVPGRRGQYSLTWSGLPNCYWWMDIEKGAAGVYLSQLLPTGDQRAVELLAEFEKAVYAALE